MFRTHATHQVLQDQISGRIEQMQSSNDETMHDDSAPDSLQEFDTYYHDLFSVEDYHNLQNLMKSLPDICKQHNHFFDHATRDPASYDLSWHDKFQHLLIGCYLEMGDSENADVNVFARPLIRFFCESTNSAHVFQTTGVQLTQEEVWHRVMFAANYLLVLRTQGRVEDDMQLLLEYNEVVDSYIRFLISPLRKSNEVKDLAFLPPGSASVDMISYYIAAGLVGKDDQLASFAFLMENILDDAV